MPADVALLREWLNRLSPQPLDPGDDRARVRCATVPHEASQIAGSIRRALRERSCLLELVKRWRLAFDDISLIRIPPHL